MLVSHVDMLLSQEHPRVVNLPQLSHDKFYEALIPLPYFFLPREEGLGTRLGAGAVLRKRIELPIF